MSDKGIALIGGAGFLGSNLVSKLGKHGEPYCIYDINTQSALDDNVLRVDVRDYRSLEQLDGHSCIINLAAEHRDDVFPLNRYDEVNVIGAKHVCMAAREHKINKIIFTSSVAIYGFAPANTGEAGEPNYFNDYGRTKYLAEQIYKQWYSEDPDNRTLVLIRPTVIFGEGNRGNVFNLLKQINSHRFIMFGNGCNKKSMAYVENVTAFLEFSLSFKPGLHIYNYVDKPDFDMNTLISKVRKTLFKKNNVGIRLPANLGLALGYFADFVAYVTNKKLSVSSIRVKKFMETTQFSSSVNKSGFVPPLSLDEGLARTLRYEFLEDNSNKRTFDTE